MDRNHPELRKVSFLFLVASSYFPLETAEAIESAGREDRS